MKRLLLIVPGALALAVCLATGPLGAGGAKSQAQLPDDVFAKFVSAEGKYLQETLAKGKPDKKESRKIVGSAAFLVAYAANSAHPDKLSVNDNAMAFYTAFKAGELDKAKALAATFYPKIQPRKDKLKDAGKIKLVELMYLFASERIGGFGVEKELDDLEEQKEKISGAQFDRLTELGQKIAIIAAMAPEYPPEFDKVKKTEKNWQRFTGEFSGAAAALTKAAQAKNEPATRDALANLGAKCIGCHDLFR
jgi:hypothetical protein